MSMKNKFWAGFSTILAIGTIATASLNVELPKTFFQKFDKGIVSSTLDESIKNDYYDPYGDRLFVSRYETKNYFRANQIPLKDNTIKIAMAKDLPKEYVEAATDASKLFEKLFEIINPNIKIELGFFEENDSNIYVRKLNENDIGVVMRAHMYSTGSRDLNGNLDMKRGDSCTKISIYNLADRTTKKSNTFSLVHEYAHAIFGFNDYNNDYTFTQYGFKDSTHPRTIMNYADLASFESVSDSPKFTILDVAMAVKEFGLFSNNPIEGENPYNSEEEYLNYVNSRLNEICYTDEQNQLAFNTTYYKMSMLDYLKLNFFNNENQNQENEQ